MRGLGEAISYCTGRVARQNLNVRSGFGALESLVCSAESLELQEESLNAQSLAKQLHLQMQCSQMWAMMLCPTSLHT